MFLKRKTYETVNLSVIVLSIREYIHIEVDNYDCLATDCYPERTINIRP